MLNSWLVQLEALKSSLLYLRWFHANAQFKSEWMINFRKKLQILARYLYFNQTIEEAMRFKRFHHQLSPMRFEYEEGFDHKIVDALESIGHATLQFDTGIVYSSVTAIHCHNGHCTPYVDPTRKGSTAVVWKWPATIHDFNSWNEKKMSTNIYF